MFQPFHPNQEVAVGNLTVQSSAESIAFSGQASWQRDQHSLRQLRALIQTLETIADEIANTFDLPETSPPPTRSSDGPTVKNPFLP